MMEIMNYNVMTTPAVVVDGEVRFKGQVPTASDVKKDFGALTPPPPCFFRRQ